MPTKREAIAQTASSLVGDGYIYGATGWICTRKRIEAQKRQYPELADLIEKYGKKWMGKRCFDCAQLTKKAAAAAGVSLPSGATSQWRAPGLWKEKGTIDTLPDEAGLFLFSVKGSVASHCGISVGGGEEVDARGHAYGVVRRPIASASYTHWARLQIDADAPADAPNPKPDAPATLRRNAKGDDVRRLQQTLEALGYSLGSSGADGVYGADTAAAVRAFQKDAGLVADGVAGEATFAALAAALQSRQTGEMGEPDPPESVCLSGRLLEKWMEALENAKVDGKEAALRLEKETFEGMTRLIRQGA